MNQNIKVGVSYLYDQNLKKLEEIDKGKFAKCLNKIARLNEVVAYYNKEIQAKKNLEKVFFNATYEETVKKMHFTKLNTGIYSYGQADKSIGIIVTIDVPKEKLEKYLGINSKPAVKKAPQQPKGLTSLQEKVRMYILDDTHRKENFADIEILNVDDNDRANQVVKEKISKWNDDKCNRFIKDVIEGDADIVMYGWSTENVKPAAPKNKVFAMEVTRVRMSGPDTKNIWVGTIDQLRQAFSYTLECGQSWEHERGNRKVNTHPTNIKSLVSNLDKASANSCRSYQDHYYEEIDLTDELYDKWVKQQATNPTSYSERLPE